MWRLISFSLYGLINEYKQELESLIKSSLFKIRKHRWDRIYTLFQQRSSYYHMYNVYLILSVLHGYCDLVANTFIRVFEFILMTLDLTTVLFNRYFFFYCLDYWLGYHYLRNIVFGSSILSTTVFINVLSMCTYLFITKVQLFIVRITVKYIVYCATYMESVLYMTAMVWNDSSWTAVVDCIYVVYGLVTVYKHVEYITGFGYWSSINLSGFAIVF